MAGLQCVCSDVFTTSCDQLRAGSGDSHNAPLWKVWSLLCPSVKDVFTKEPEMLGIGVLCACRYIELRLATSAVTALNTTLVSRSMPEFLVGLRNMTMVSLLGSWLRIGYSYCQARLTWKWKRNSPTVSMTCTLKESTII